jgi:hypothetical protein
MRLKGVYYGWFVGGALCIMMFGAANGMSTLARANSVAEIFGPRHYGAISEALALGANGARAVGPWPLRSWSWPLAPTSTSSGSSRLRSPP